jgi:membrane protease YdiL (CAAX protease family)
LSAPENPIPAPEFLESTPVAAAPRRNDDPVWTGWDVLILTVVAVLSMVIFGAFGLIIAHQFPNLRSIPIQELAKDARVIIPAQAAAYAVVLAFMYLMIHQYMVPFGKSIRWRWPGTLAAGLIAVGVVVALVIEVVEAYLPMPKHLPVDQYFRTATSAWIMAVFGTLIAPVIEELFFRGFLYPVLARRLGVVIGVVLTSVAFALIHQSQLAHAWVPLAVLFVVGVVLTLTRVITNSVACSVLVHMGYNATLFLSLYIVSDHFQHLEKVAQ